MRRRGRIALPQNPSSWGGGSIGRDDSIGGVGVDLVDNERMASTLKRSRGFAEQVFTARERRERIGRRDVGRHLAGCFAAKEAFLKAVGVGLWQHIPLQQIEMVRGSSGHPELRLGAMAKKALRHKGCGSAMLSLTRERKITVAIVMIQ